MTRTPSADAALEALTDALVEHDLPAPSGDSVLFLRARADLRLATLARHGWVCQQSFKPFADAVGRLGLDVRRDAPEQRFARVLLLPPRSRDEARALLVQGLDHLQPGGTLVVSASNREGARSIEGDLERVAGVAGHVSQRRCRVFWSTPDDADVDVALCDAWRALDRVREIADGRFLSRPGLFAWDRIDAASALLAAHLPASLKGDVADLGAGYGYLACEIIERCPQLRSLDLYEAEARALEPAERNTAAACARRGRDIDVGVHWHDVTTGLPRRYDVIVSNPPFHQGRADEPDLGRAFIRSAAGALRPEGELWLVANRHLPYETTLREAFAQVHEVAVVDGFKVITASGVRT